LIRIAHFTDLHVTDRPGAIRWQDLLGKRLLGWVNLALLGRHGVFAGAAGVAHALVRDLLEVVRPDHIVSTGDLTGLSLPGEFKAAREALGPLLADPRVTGIPGNHDVYVRGAVRDRLYESAFGAWTRTDLAGEELPEGHRVLHPYPLVRFLGSDAALVCLHDVRPNPLHDSSGLVGPRQLAALEAVLQSPRLYGRVKVLALHYGLCRADRSPDTRIHGLRDASEVIRVAARGGVALVLHGHLHGRFLLPRAEGWPFVIANPGSVASAKPHHKRAYHLITIGDGVLRIEARRFDEAEACFKAWPEAAFESAIRR